MQVSWGSAKARKLRESIFDDYCFEWVAVWISYHSTIVMEVGRYENVIHRIG